MHCHATVQATGLLAYIDSTSCTVVGHCPLNLYFKDASFAHNKYNKLYQSQYCPMFDLSNKLLHDNAYVINKLLILHTF